MCTYATQQVPPPPKAGIILLRKGYCVLCIITSRNNTYVLPQRDLEKNHYYSFICSFTVLLHRLYFNKIMRLTFTIGVQYLFMQCNKNA